MKAVVTKPCEHCQSSFKKDPRCTWAYFSRQKYCSQACAGKAYSIARISQRPDLAVKFSEYFSRPATGCWEWQGITDKDGYGLFPYDGELLRAAKVALELDGRPVPKGLYACHDCDNPPCVRPDHLYPGTPTQNMADAIARRRLNPKTKLTEDQVRSIRREVGTHGQIAETYNVSSSTISMIRSGRTWRHLS